MHRVAHVLAVVEHERPALPRARFEQRLLQVAGADPEPERPRHTGGDLVGRRRRQLHHQRGIDHPAIDQLLDQPGLARPAGAADRDDSVAGPRVGHRGKLERPADEAIGRGEALRHDGRRRDGARVGRAGRSQRGVLGEDAPLEVGDRRARFEPGAFDRARSELGPDAQRLGGAPGAVQDLHQQEVHRLVGGVLGGRSLEVGQDGARLARRDPREQPALDGPAPQGDQPRPFGRERERVGQVPEGLAAPERQRVGEAGGGTRRVVGEPSLGPVDQIGEAHHVDLLRYEVEAVARRLPHDQPRPDLTTEPGDVALQVAHGVVGSLSRPERIDQRRIGHAPRHRERQPGQHGALRCADDGRGLAVAIEERRPQQGHEGAVRHRPIVTHATGRNGGPASLVGRSGRSSSRDPAGTRQARRSMIDP